MGIEDYRIISASNVDYAKAHSLVQDEIILHSFKGFILTREVFVSRSTTDFGDIITTAAQAMVKYKQPAKKILQ